MARVRRVLIMGAAGRDFHNFNVAFRANPAYRVVAFTAFQIPYIAGRTYPPELAGESYPDGIPIFDEGELPHLVRELEETINAVPCDVVLVGTPFDLGRLVRSTRPLIRVSYSLDEASTLALGRVLDGFPSSRKG